MVESTLFEQQREVALQKDDKTRYPHRLRGIYPHLAPQRIRGAPRGYLD